MKIQKAGITAEENIFIAGGNILKQFMNVYCRIGLTQNSYSAEQPDEGGI
jgi:hypothetical protein